MPINPDILVTTLIASRSRLIGYAWVIVGDAHTAEDIFQDISLAAVHKCGEINDAAHLERWLIHAIRLRSIQVRRNHRHHALLLDPQILDSIEEEWASRSDSDAADCTDALKHCIAELSPMAKELVALRYGEGLKSGRIAEKLGKRKETIYKGIARTNAALAECVARRLGSGKRVEGNR